MIYVGIDIYKKTNTSRAINSEGEVVHRSTVSSVESG
jgi:hypothetical protein